MNTSQKQLDEFDAFRLLVETLRPFKRDDQERLLRWVQEKLGLAPSAAGLSTGMPPVVSPQVTPPAHSSVHGPQHVRDIKSFVEAKHPKSDNQFTAVVAYFYKFEAPQSQRKDFITREDLVTACRQANRKRPANPAQVLVNAHHQGLLDKDGAERGHYRLNSVGENLVAIVLPNQDKYASGEPDRKKRSAKNSRKPKRAGR